MLKAFVYSDSDIMRVAGFSQEQIERARVKLPVEFEATQNAGLADFFWMPIDMGHWEAYHGGAGAIKAGMPKLAHWTGNERRHAAFFCSDGAEPVGLPFIMFRNSYNKNRPDENVVAWPYACEDFGELCTDDFDALKYDVSIVANISGVKLRLEACNSIKETPGIRHLIDDTHLNWGTVEHTEYGKQRRAIYLQSIKDSRMILAPRGGGMTSARFFEAMSAGRVPILISDNWELPYQDFIDWDKCMIQIPENQVRQTGKILLDFLRHTSNTTLLMMGREARQAWIEFLMPAMWSKMMAWYVGKILR